MDRSRFTKPALLLALASAAAWPVVACSKDKPADNPQAMNAPPPGGQCPPGYPNCTPTGPGTAPYPGTYPTGPGTAPPPGSQGPMGPTDQNQLATILQGVAAAASALMAPPGGANPTDSGEVGLRSQAARSAPGMAPDGQMMKQQLNEGQHATMMVPMEPTKCYVIVGYSPPGGVKDLNLNLLMPGGLLLSAQDTTHHNMPVVAGQGGQPMCPLMNIGAYKLDVHAGSGSGQVLVQVYSKPK